MKSKTYKKRKTIIKLVLAEFYGDEYMTFDELSERILASIGMGENEVKDVRPQSSQEVTRDKS